MDEKNEGIHEKKGLNYQFMLKVFLAIILAEALIFLFFNSGVGEKKYTLVLHEDKKDPIEKYEGFSNRARKNELLFDCMPELARSQFTVDIDSKPSCTIIKNNKGDIVYNKPGRLNGNQRVKTLRQLRNAGKINKVYSVAVDSKTIVYKSGNMNSTIKTYKGEISPEELLVRMEVLGIENDSDYKHIHKTTITNNNGDSKVYERKLEGAALSSVIKNLEKSEFLEVDSKIIITEDKSKTTFITPDGDKHLYSRLIGNVHTQNEIIDGLRLGIISKKGYRVINKPELVHFHTRHWFVASVCIPLGIFILNYLILACMQAFFSSSKAKEKNEEINTPFSDAYKKEGQNKTMFMLDLLKYSNIFVAAIIVWLVTFFGFHVIPEMFIWIMKSTNEFIRESWWIFISAIVGVVVLAIVFLFYWTRIVIRDKELQADVQKDYNKNIIKANRQLSEKGMPLLPYSGSKTVSSNKQLPEKTKGADDETVIELTEGDAGYAEK